MLGPSNYVPSNLNTHNSPLTQKNASNTTFFYELLLDKMMCFIFNRIILWGLFSINSFDFESNVSVCYKEILLVIITNRIKKRIQVRRLHNFGIELLANPLLLTVGQARFYLLTCTQNSRCLDRKGLFFFEQNYFNSKTLT